MHFSAFFIFSRVVFMIPRPICFKIMLFCESCALYILIILNCNRNTLSLRMLSVFLQKRLPVNIILEFHSIASKETHSWHLQSSFHLLQICWSDILPLMIVFQISFSLLTNAFDCSGDCGAFYNSKGLPICNHLLIFNFCFLGHFFEGAFSHF